VWPADCHSPRFMLHHHFLAGQHQTGERRQASVLFADLMRYTKLSASWTRRRCTGCSAASSSASTASSGATVAQSTGRSRDGLRNGPQQDRRAAQTRHSGGRNEMPVPLSVEATGLAGLSRAVHPAAEFFALCGRGRVM
jgi:hypothetical protein